MRRPLIDDTSTELAGLGFVPQFAKLADVWDTALRLWGGCGLTDAHLATIGGMLSSRAGEIERDFGVPAGEAAAFRQILKKPAMTLSCTPAARFSESDAQAVIKRLTQDAGWSPERYDQGASFWQNFKETILGQSVTPGAPKKTWTDLVSAPMFKIGTFDVKPWHVALGLAVVGGALVFRRR